MKSPRLQSPFLVVLLTSSLFPADDHAQEVERSGTLAPPATRSAFTHAPVDLARLFSARTYDGTTPITPFFNYDNTAHAEGPRKWYIYGSQTEPLEVFLPTRASLQLEGLRNSEESGGLTVNTEKVRPNMNVTFQVDKDLSFFFMHLCLRETIAQRVEQAGGRAVTFEAGTHIGYVHNPPWNSLDFGMEDRRRNSGMAVDPNLWWNLRANPLDYFEPELRNQILQAYRPVLERLQKDGTVPYSDLTDSRANIQVSGTLWGVWFKDDLGDPFRQHLVNWSIISLVPKQTLHRDTYWKALEEDPDHAGLFTENGRGQRVGRPLYPGDPLGRSRFYLLSGDDHGGAAKIVHRYDRTRVVFLKFRVSAHDPRQPHDDELLMESHPTAESAESTPFSEKAVRFRRNPSRLGTSR